MNQGKDRRGDALFSSPRLSAHRAMGYQTCPRAAIGYNGGFAPPPIEVADSKSDQLPFQPGWTDLHRRLKFATRENSTRAEAKIPLGASTAEEMAGLGILFSANRKHLHHRGGLARRRGISLPWWANAVAATRVNDPKSSGVPFMLNAHVGNI